MDTCHDIIPDDEYVVVPVWTGMFVPEADDVSQFVNDNPELVTVLPDGYRLRAVPSLADEGTTPEGKRTTFIARYRGI